MLVKDEGVYVRHGLEPAHMADTYGVTDEVTGVSFHTPVATIPTLPIKPREKSQSLLPMISQNTFRSMPSNGKC